MNELAELLRVDVATVRRWRRAGSLPPAVAIGKSLRWRPETVEQWLHNREAAR